MISRLEDLRSAAAAPAEPPTPASPSGLGRLLLSGRRSPQPSPPASPGPGRSSRGTDGSLQAYLARLEEVKRGPLHQLQAQLQEARALHGHALRATTARQEREALERAESCAERASAAAAGTCRSLQALAGQVEAGGPSESSLRRQAFAGVSVLFQNALNALFQAQQTFRAEMEAKVSRQFRAAFPEADDAAVAAVVQGQRSAASTIQDTLRLQPGTGPLNTAMALQMSRDHCDELARLARAARELQQAFLDVESLVESQGGAIDDIARHIESTRERTYEARRELDMANASVRAWRRCRYCSIGMGLIVLICIIIFVLLRHWK